MKSKKRIKQIGPSSFLFCNVPEVIYNIKTDNSIDNSTLYVTVIKMKKTNTYIYKTKLTQNQFALVTAPNKIIKSAYDALIELNYYIYNHLFCINETVDNMEIIIYAYPDLAKNKPIILTKVEDINDDLINEKNDYSNEIRTLLDTLAIQRNRISQLEQKELSLINRVNNLEITNQKLMALIAPPEEEPPINQYSHKRLKTFDNQLPSQIQKPMINPQKSNQIIPPSFGGGHNRVGSSNDLPRKKVMQRYNTNPTFQKPASHYPCMTLGPGGSPIADSKEIELIRMWMDPIYQNSRCQLIYKASIHSFSAVSAHRLIDEEFPTFCIILSSNGYKFGGFTTQYWKGNNEYKADVRAFLFNLTLKKKYPINKKDVNDAICSRDGYIVIFGKGADLAIGDQTKGIDSFSNFPYSYGENELKSSLTGGDTIFRIKDIEIYKIISY